nr:hypothetical protein [Kibdelosporangium sp. MJ126-NF4]
MTTRPTRVLGKKPPPAPKAGPLSLPQSNAAASAALRAGSKPAVLERFQSAGQNAVGNSAVAAAQRAKGKPEDKPRQQTPPEEGAAAGGQGKRGPDRDPKFASLKKDVQRKKRGVASSHPPPRAEASSAQDAALPPKDDEQAQGKTANAEKMNEAKPKEFDKAAFVKAVEDAIARKAPKNLDEADKFADSGKPAEIKADVQGRVGEGKSDSAEQISATTAAPPDTSVAVTKQVVPMAPDRPPGAPGTPNPANAAPDRLPPSATDMSAGPARVNQEMADAHVTETQLKKSNEPQFTKALDEKKTAEQHSETAPGELRQNESAQLKQTTAQAKKLGTAAMNAMAAKRVNIGQQVGSGKSGAKGKDEDKRAQVTALLQKVFDTMKTEVEGILSALDKTVDKEFTEGEKKARDEFTDEHKRKMEAYKDERYSGAWGWARWLDDRFTGLPAEADKIFDEARDNYIANMRHVISAVADTIGRELTKAKARIAKGRDELQAEVKKLPTDLQSIGKEAAAGFADQFDSLTQSVDDKGTELVDTLATKYTDALKSVDDEIAAEKEKNKGLIAKAIDAVKAVINTILELMRMLRTILAKAAQAAEGIVKDPIGFLGNLVRAVGAGLRQFMANIGTHLPQGILSWLVGRAAEAGLQLPAKFDTRGVLTMLAGILGLTPAAIWARITRRLPPKAAEAAEGAVPLVAQVRKQGVAGMWNDLKTRVGDLRKQLIDKVIEYAKPAIIIAGITWIISLLNPASAFVRAVKLIIDIIRFVVTQARQIFDFVNAVLDAVIAIARGSGGGVPGLIERALVRAIPVLLGFLATLLGLGGLAAKVRQIIQTISRPVGRAIDAVIDKIIALIKRALPKSKAKPDKKKPDPTRKSKRKKDRDKPKRPKKPRRPTKRKDDKPRKPSKAPRKDPPKTKDKDSTKDKTRVVDRRTSVGTESHTLRARASRKRLTLLMASDGFGLINTKVKVLRQLAGEELRSGEPSRVDRGNGLNKALDNVEVRARKVIADYMGAPPSAARDRKLDDGLNDLSELIRDIGVKFQIPGLDFTRPDHNPVPSPLDGYGRATGYSGNPLSRASAKKGSGASGYVPGITIPGLGTIERGHLLAKNLGGSGSDRRNLSPIVLTANTAMKAPERQVADFIYTGDVSNRVVYTVQVHHQFSGTAAFQTWLAATFPPSGPDAAQTLFELAKTHRPDGSEINAALGGPPRTSAQHQHVLRGLGYYLLKSTISISITATAGPMNTVAKPGSTWTIDNNIPPP